MNDELPNTDSFASLTNWGKRWARVEESEDGSEAGWRQGWKGLQMGDAAVAGRQGTQFTAPVGHDRSKAEGRR